MRAGEKILDKKEEQTPHEGGFHHVCMTRARLKKDEHLILIMGEVFTLSALQEKGFKKRST